MRRKIQLVGLLILLAFGLRPVAFSQTEELKSLSPKEEHPQALFVTLTLLEQYHFRRLSLSDSMSSVIFDNYIGALDPTKSYFLKSDVAYFEKYRDQLDNDLRNSNLDVAYQIFSIYRERALERYRKISRLLIKEFDFSRDEYYDTDFEKVEWATSREELDERWRVILKNQSIAYKLSGKEWHEITKSLKNRYNRSRKLVYQYNSEDVFETYLNSVTQAFDPHTNYFSPISSENFQMAMSLSLEGIGARLSQRLDYTVVAEIVPGGPAFKSKQLHKDDKIIGVAQGDDGEFIDVIGWRLDDVVQKIRGPKGSVVRLQILKKGDVNALPDTLRLVREKIKLEDEAAQAELIPITQGNETFNLGIITIPSFYINFEDKNNGVQDYKSTTRDVRKLITNLKDRGMDGLLIDLRYNGGGSLTEAIELTGLFIPSGPVVQVKNIDRSVEAHYDRDSQIFYDGPLAVLTNRYSASASEIFSGAIQDYKRGVILGENSFGKGTVQNLIDLDRYVMGRTMDLLSKPQKSEREATSLLNTYNGIKSGKIRVGQLKMTLAKFYRATGSSTQKQGVQPDISFPSPFDPDTFGESGRENALPWDEISSAPFNPTNEISEELLDNLYALYLDDITNDKVMQQLVKEVEETRTDILDTRISLNLDVRRSESEDTDDMSTTISQSEVLTSDEHREKLSEDAYLRESLKLLAKMVKSKVG